ncbi:MAG: hypothetical protein JWN40_5282, partial [Phycisphaerales bacterium]|nr:hypothetical protein [Phycisphaerales bacterium]
TISGTLSLTATNSYTGGTVVNGGSIVALTGVGFIPKGGVTINSSTLTTATSGQIESTNDVTINGAGVLTLVGSNSLNSLTFNNNGGIANPTVNTGTSGLTLSATNAIIAVNDNALTVPTIAGGTLTLPDGANINTSTTAFVPTNLVISAPIFGGAVNKTGTGSLVLSGANTFTGPLNLNTGTLIFAANSTSTTASPAGAGTLAISGGTAIMSDGTLRTIVNPVTVGGDFTLGSLSGANGSAIAGNGVVLSGNVDLGAAANRAINVNSLLNTSTLSGVIGGVGSSITKTGPGTLALGVTTLSSVTVNASTTVTVPTTVGLVAGMPVAGTNIPAGATIASITNATTFALSVNATGAATSNLQYTSTGSNTFDGGVNINAGTLQAGNASALGTGTIKFGGGILQHALLNTTDYSARFSTASNQPIYVDTNGATVTYASPITSAVGGTLGKFGAGTLILTNTATYDGITLINAGTLQVGAGGTVGSIPLANSISDAGTLAWNRSDNATLSGVISGAGAITKFSPGDLTLSGVNTFTGNVTMQTATPVPSSGSITITNSSALGVGPKTITIIDNSPTNTAVLKLDGTTGNINLASNISFTTSSATGVGGIMNVAGDNTINGNFTLSSGGGSTQLTVNGGTLTLAAGATLIPNTNGRQLILNGPGNGTVNATAKDQNQTNFLSLVKSGAGTWTLGAANTYTGSTTINGGILKLTNAAGLGTATGVLTLPTTDNSTTITGTGTLDLNGLSTVNEAIRLNGTGLGGNGALINTGAAATLGGTVAAINSAAVTSGVGTAPVINFTGGGGTGATGTANLGVTAASFTITGGTTVYSAAPTVAITAGGGAGATATAVLSGGTTGTVTGITITNSGSGFTGVPTIAFTGGTVTTAGTNPTGAGNGSNFNVQAYTITNAGTGYTSAPTATLSSSTGTNATTVTPLLAGVILTGDSSIGGTGDITLKGAVTETGGPRALTKIGANTLNLAGNNPFTGATTVTGGKLSVTGSIASSSGVTVNNAAATFEAAAAQTVKALTVTAGKARVVNATKVALTVGDGTATSSPLSLTGGTLDLTTNGVAIHYAAGNDAAVLASTRAQLIAGYGAGGNWTGTTGITSSTAVANSLAAVGYALAPDVLPFANGATTDTFLGTTVDKNTVIARYTLSGDLNLDGAVDFLDLARLAQSYNVTDGTRQWATGDVNYDGNTDFLDLAKMAQNYNTALPSSPVPGASADFQADLAKAFAAVPEPGTISVLGIGAVALLARRRNRRAA